LNNKIISRKQLQQLSSIPVLAEIDQAQDGGDSIVVSGRDPQLSESNSGLYEQISHFTESPEKPCL